MKRRDLVTGGLKAVVTSPFFSQALAQTLGDLPQCAPCSPAPFPAAPSPGAKLRVKPIMTNMLPSGILYIVSRTESPCAIFNKPKLKSYRIPWPHWQNIADE